MFLWLMCHKFSHNNCCGGILLFSHFHWEWVTQKSIEQVHHIPLLFSLRRASPWCHKALYILWLPNSNKQWRMSVNMVIDAHSPTFKSMMYPHNSLMNCLSFSLRFFQWRVVLEKESLLFFLFFLDSSPFSRLLFYLLCMGYWSLDM